MKSFIISSKQKGEETLMKKTKVISILTLASSFVLAGCGEKPNPDCSHVDDNKDHLCDKCGEKVSDHAAAAEWKHDEHDHWHVCSFDGCDVVLDKAAHSFGEWSVVTPATFEKDGVEHRVCGCGYEETRPITKLQHNFSSDWSKDAEKHWHACTDEGYENLKKDEAAHSFGDWSEKSPADFEHKKVEHRFCSDCGHEEEREVGEVLPHNYSSDWSKDAEKHWHACTDAGYEDLVSDEAAHSFGEWSEKSPADFEHKKVEHRFCEVCEHEEEREVGDVVPHNYSNSWSMDSDEHWHACIDAGYETLKSDVEAHEDLDENHFCDVCEQFIGEHGEGSTIDHKCDYCGKELTVLHSDANNDHKCDVCEVTISEHVDTDYDHMCEICGDKIDECYDENLDHYCDWCFESICDHEEGDVEDHKCDYCGEYLPYEHYDFDYDDKCDICGVTMPLVQGTINCPYTYIGRGETLHVSSDVVAYGGATTDVYWYLTKNTTYYKLTDNYDGTADIRLTDNTSTSSYASVLQLCSSFDDSVLAEVSLSCSTYGSEKRTTLENFFGSWNLFPYIGSATFVNSTDGGKTMSGYSTYNYSTNGFERILGAIRNTGCFVETEKDGHHYFTGSNVDAYVMDAIFVLDIYKDEANSRTAFEFTKIDTNSAEFPAENISSLLGVELSDVVLPTDGTAFSYYYDVKKEEVGVYSDCEKDAYVAALVEAGYIMENEGESAYAPSILVSPSRKLIVSVLDGDFTFFVQPVPTDTDWSDEAKEIMLEKLGEVLPFINNGYYVYPDPYGSNKVCASPAIAGAYNEATKVLEADSSFTKVNEFKFVKNVGTYLDLVVDLNDGGFIWAYLQDNLPEGSSYEFPMDNVKNIIGKGSKDLVVAAEGSLFTLTKNDNYDVDVKVEGGDKYQYMLTLLENGFESTELGLYNKDNLVVSVSSVEGGYLINFSLKEEPVPASWPTEALSSMFPMHGFELTQPAVGTIEDVVVNEGSKTITITMSEIGKTDFKNHLSECGFAAYDGYAYDTDYEMYITWKLSGGNLVISIESGF